MLSLLSRFRDRPAVDYSSDRTPSGDSSDSDIESPESPDIDFGYDTDETFGGSDSQGDSHCPICHEPFNKRCMVSTCGHLFDEACITTWTKNNGPERHDCPLCRARMVEIRYNFEGKERRIIPVTDGATSFKVDIPAATLDGMIKLNNTIDPDFDPTTIDPRQRHLALERRRLKRWKGFDLVIRARYLDVLVQADEGPIIVRRNLSVKITQKGNQTTSEVLRELKMMPYFSYGEHITPSTDSVFLEEYENAKREAERTWKRWGNENDMIQQLTVRPWSHICLMHDRGLQSAISYSQISISRLRNGDIYHIQWRTLLRERGPAIADDDLAPVECGSPHLPEEIRQAATLGVRRATEKIQVTLEWLGKEQKYGGGHIDRATTNIMEPIRHELKCLACEEPHRNGECELPQKVILRSIEG